MGVLLKLFFVTAILPVVFGQEACYGAGSVIGAAVGAFFGALLLVAVAFYLRKLYLKTREGKHLILSTDPESVKDEFAFDNPGFKHEEKRFWQHEAPTLPVGGKRMTMQADFVPPQRTRDDMHVHRGRVRRVQLWARDFTGLGLRCGGGAREGVHVHSVLRSGPAAAANLQPGDKIKSIKIEFTGTPLEDAVGILSLASPYPVELEIVEGGRASGQGRMLAHPLLKRAASQGDVNALEKESKHLMPPRSPNASHSNNSTLENKQSKGGIKKMITEKIITSSTLERNKKDKKDVQVATLERENDKNKQSNKRHSDIPNSFSKPDKVKSRYSTGAEHQIENGNAYIENAEVQKKEYDPKKPMKFGIRVLPPNVPDDGVLIQKENGIISDRKVIDEPDKPEFATVTTTHVRVESEKEVKKPVVAKRREKMAPPIPNVRTKIQDPELNTSNDSSRSESSFRTFSRNDLNSSGIKRDENGIPQELPSHMFEAARAAKNNRKSTYESALEKDNLDSKKEEAPKASKKSKGKAPSPPETERNKTDDSIIEQLNNVTDFLKNEKQHSSILHDNSSISSNTSSTFANTSTPKVYKNRPAPRPDESIKFTQEDIDDIITRPFKNGSDSMNNLYEDSKSNLSSNQDGHSVVSFNNSEKSDKGSTTIELNNSDVTIHSSALNETLQSASDSASILDENERKAASLGDLSRFAMQTKGNNTSTGTLERAQSLDISGEETECKENTMSPKKRKALSVVETTFLDQSSEDVLPDMIHSEKVIIMKHKEPRLSLDIAKSSMEGLSTFQRNRLKKASEFGNLEDAIVKGSDSSIDSDKPPSKGDRHVFKPEFDLSKDTDSHESSDHLARRIMDENIKVHLKLVSEFAKSTSDDSNMSSLDSSKDAQSPIPSYKESQKITEQTKANYPQDLNIPDDMKVSRNTYANSLERPKSDMMKKLLAKNPILNVHVDQDAKPERLNSSTQITSKSTYNQPDIVNFNLRSKETQNKDDDFVSHIKVGSNNNSLKHGAKIGSYPDPPTNIVTITTNEKTQATPEPRDRTLKTYTKSIEIGDTSRRGFPDVLEEIRKRGEEKDKKTLYYEPENVSIKMTQEPVHKTVTVNVTEDDMGNKVITQNVEQISTKYSTFKSEAPLQIEQVSFGMTRNPQEIDQLTLEEGDVKSIDKKVLDEIKKQNPNMHFTTDEPAYTKTETIILNTHLDEKHAMELMEKIKNDPSFMAQKTPEELSKLGIRIIRDLNDTRIEEFDTVETTKTRYTIDPSKLNEDSVCEDKREQIDKGHITEIHVATPDSKIATKQKINDEVSRRQQISSEEPTLSYELDIDLLNDFISNERYHSSKEQADVKKRKSKIIEPKKHHSDFDLPRNSQIMFRTATYESPKGTIVTSTDLENRRLSQMDQMQLRSGNDTSPAKPVISAKPSNIPVKTPEKKPATLAVSSKIPVFMSQKSLSQDNLTERTFTLPSSPQAALSSSTANISVTSIKSSSKHPSGK